MSESFDLSKGGSFNLSKAAPKSSRFRIGLTWPNTGIDLDVSAFVLDANGKLMGRNFLFYNNPALDNGCLIHSGDNRSGTAASDDEVIDADLSKIPAGATEVSFVVTIHEDENTSPAVQNSTFGAIRQMAKAGDEEVSIRIVDADNGTELCKYELNDIAPNATGVQFGSLVFDQASQQWSFKAVGAAGVATLSTFLSQYQ